MSINLYAGMAPMYDCVGRLDYMTNPDRQEHLLATAGQLDPEFWARLSNDAQVAWRESGGARTMMVKVRDKETGEELLAEKEKRACEARENHVMLPYSLYEAGEEALKKAAQDLSTFVYEQYGVANAVAIHLSKTRKNVHAHILFAERSELLVPDVRIADRATYLDENGVRKRTKKEILDAEGKLRPGCRIVPKGDVISTRYFGDKLGFLEDREWLAQCKMDLAEWINENLTPDVLRTVYNPDGPYLPQMHVGKGRPEDQKAEIELYNKIVRAFNSDVKSGDIDRDTAEAIKGYVSLSPNRGQALKDLFELRGAGSVANERTRGDGKEEQLKRQLREEYRLAARCRLEAGNDKLSADRQIMLAKARQHSQRIDQLQAELMRLRAEKEGDEKEARRWTEMQRRLREQEYYQAQRNLARCNNRIKYLWNRLGYLQVQESRMGLFSDDRQEVLAEIAAVKEEIDEEYQKRAELKWAESVIRDKVKQDRKDRRQENKEAKELFRQMRDEGRAQKRAQKGPDVGRGGRG